MNVSHSRAFALLIQAMLTAIAASVIAAPEALADITARMSPATVATIRACTRVETFRVYPYQQVQEGMKALPPREPLGSLAGFPITEIGPDLDGFSPGFTDTSERA